MSEVFSFGIAGCPSDTDKRFDTLASAMLAASEYQFNNPWDSVLAVWEDETGECLLIIYDGQWFAPEN